MADVCRICSGRLSQPEYEAPAPSITSLGAAVPLPIKVWVCRSCAHTQSSELPDLLDYYDKGYEISLDSEEHDQLYEVVDGREIYRTEKQAQLVQDFAKPDQGAKILDYGAAKAATLRKLCESRSDLLAHVFDVSDSYSGQWAKWIPEERCATYQLPASWEKSFDLVTAHFVLEHVADPIGVLRNLHSALTTGGKVFLSVPNAVANSGDFLVADHINHFSRTSLEAAIVRAGFRVITIDQDAYRGAFVAVAECLEAGSQAVSYSNFKASDDEVRAFTDLGSFWSTATKLLSDEVEKRGRHHCAIYGAGFYGSFIALRIGDSADIACFVDRNPHVRLLPLMGRPVVAPSELPEEIEVVYAGLNPASARKILDDVAEWRDRKIEVVYLD